MIYIFAFLFILLFSTTGLILGIYDQFPGAYIVPVIGHLVATFIYIVSSAPITIVIYQLFTAIIMALIFFVINYKYKLNLEKG